MYQLIYDEDGQIAAVRREADGASIPLDAGNADYRAFHHWNEQANPPLCELPPLEEEE